jgi:hypothetical protein
MRSGYCDLDIMSSPPAAVSAASAASAADTTASKVARDAVLNANIASICAMEASNKAAATATRRVARGLARQGAVFGEVAS